VVDEIVKFVKVEGVEGVEEALNGMVEYFLKVKQEVLMED